MAIYHLNARIVKRSQGQSAVAKAAYNARDLLTNENTGDRHDYRYKGETLFSGIFVPKNAPDWVNELIQDRQALWSAIEGAEKRKDSQLAREVEISLPHELTEQQREHLVKDFVRENFVRKGMIADVSLHAPSVKGDTRNYHAHILLSMREIGPDRFGEKVREWNSKEQLQEWREKWEHLANRHLERHGHKERIDHRSLQEQGIDREPTIHIGPTATELERDGLKTERGDRHRSIEDRNRQFDQLQAADKDLAAAIEKNERQLDEELKEQQRRAAHMGATLYDHAGMATQQRDALRHVKDKQKARQAGNDDFVSEIDAHVTKKPSATSIRNQPPIQQQGKQQTARPEPTPQQEQANSEVKEKGQSEQRSDERKARTEQTAEQVRQQQREAMREMFERRFGNGHSTATRENWEQSRGGRTRER